MRLHQLKILWQKVPVDYYDRGLKENLGQRLWHTQKMVVLRRVVKDLSPKKILDIGTNSGALTTKIARLFPGAATTGIDVYEKAIKYARCQHSQIRFLVADAQKLPFQNKTFDLIFCVETLEHVVSPPKVLQEIKRCLKNSGSAVISMDSGSFLFNLIWFFWTKFGRGRVWQGAHLWQFNRKKLKEMILKEKLFIDKEIISHLGMAVTFRVKKR